MNVDVFYYLAVSHLFRERRTEHGTRQAENKKVKHEIAETNEQRMNWCVVGGGGVLLQIFCHAVFVFG